MMGTYSMIKIVKAVMDDDIVAQLIELSVLWANEQVTYGLIPNTREDLKEPCFLAMDGDKVVGYTFGHVYENDMKGPAAPIGDPCFMIDEIYVLPEYRSQGIGKRLFEAIEEEVKSSVTSITLSTSTKDYQKILKFYAEEVGMTFHYAFLFKKC